MKNLPEHIKTKEFVINSPHIKKGAQVDALILTDQSKCFNEKLPGIFSFI